jgi:hypothetical protein
VQKNLAFLSGTKNEASFSNGHSSLKIRKFVLPPRSGKGTKIGQSSSKQQN